MKKHNAHRVRKRTSTVATNEFPWRFIILTVVCACILAAGFFFAARQHFMMMEFGLKNSKLRKQIDELESERRRLVLAKEVSISPMEIARAAHVAGLRENKAIAESDSVSEVKKETAVPGVQPVLASVREPKKSEKAEVKTVEPKKLMKQIIQQAAAKSVTPDERPRIVGDADKRVASSSTKSSPKMR